VRILLDTHVVLWALADSPRLSVRARELLADAGNECWVSSASAWEIAIKASIGKFRAGVALDRLEQGIEAAGFATLDVTIRHAAAVAHVSLPHGDPFDRLLIAQCEVETLRLLTADARLAPLPVAIAC
jgi:PIN domain nuclease of toxin-antitoxin system